MQVAAEASDCVGFSVYEFVSAAEWSEELGAQPASYQDVHCSESSVRGAFISRCMVLAAQLRFRAALRLKRRRFSSTRALCTVFRFLDHLKFLKDEVSDLVWSHLDPAWTSFLKVPTRDIQHEPEPTGPQFSAGEDPLCRQVKNDPAHDVSALLAVGADASAEAHWCALKGRTFEDIFEGLEGPHRFAPSPAANAQESRLSV